MIIYVLILTTFQCPGGMFGGLIPSKIKPFVCEQKRTFQLFDPAQRSKAEDRVREIGPDAELQACRGTRCKTISRWVPIFEEEPWKK